MELSNLLSYCKVSPKSARFNESENNNSNVIDIIKYVELKNKELLLLKEEYEKIIVGYRKLVFKISYTNNNELYYTI